MDHNRAPYFPTAVGLWVVRTVYQGGRVGGDGEELRLARRTDPE